MAGLGLVKPFTTRPSGTVERALRRNRPWLALYGTLCALTVAGVVIVPNWHLPRLEVPLRAVQRHSVVWLYQALGHMAVRLWGSNPSEGRTAVSYRLFLRAVVVTCV